MFVSIMAFFAKISDSSVGGTYMTLLNTVSNFGANWPAILALYFVDPLTWKQCEGGVESFDNACRDTIEKDVSYALICDIYVCLIYFKISPNAIRKLFRRLNTEIFNKLIHINV